MVNQDQSRADRSGSTSEPSTRLQPRTQSTFRPEEVPHDALWQALANDSGCRVAIIDADGRFHYCNDAVTHKHRDVDNGNVVGRTLHEIASHEQADEWLGFIRQALDQGKTIRTEVIYRGIRVVGAIRPLDPSPATRALVTSRDAIHPEDTPPDPDKVIRGKVADMGPLANLTPREIEILSFIGQGFTSAQIAEHLNRSIKTVEWHQVSLGQKLGARSRVELARIAMAAGLAHQTEDSSTPNSR